MQRVKQHAKTILSALGYDFRNWLRIRQIEAFGDFLSARPDDSHILEISPDWNSSWRSFTTNYSSVEYPAFDVCKHSLKEAFDVVIADQVLEHVQDPRAAIANMKSMLNSDGYLMIATPFLFRIHARPHDYSRWTQQGLRALLEQSDFQADRISTASWGNKACARAHIGGEVRRYGFYRNLSNDPDYPLQVWAFARNG